MSLPPIINASLPSSFGIALVGAYSSSMLFGITSHQCFRYFRMFPHDHFLLRRLVFVLWCLTTASTIFIIHQSYYYLVSRRLQLQYLVRPVWSIKLVLLISGIPAFATRIFLAHRLYTIYKRNPWICGPLVVLGILGIGSCIAATVTSYNTSRLLVLPKAAGWLYDVTLGISAISDVGTAALLSAYLVKNRKSYPIPETTSSIVILFAVNACWITSILSTAAFICALSMPSKLVSLTLTQAVGELHVNSFMTILHSRRSRYSSPLAQIGSFGLGDEMDLRGLFEFRTPFDHIDGTQAPSNAFAIHITKETHTIVDGISERGETEYDTSTGTAKSTTECSDSIAL